jgi:hypothetical protein
MAQFDFRGLDDLVAQLNRLGRIDEIAPKMIDGSIDLLEDEVKAELEHHKDTGDMLASIETTRATLNQYGGYYAYVRPSGVDRDGTRNVEKLVYLEYGAKGRSATPVLKRATIRAAPKIKEKMVAIFEREING